MLGGNEVILRVLGPVELFVDDTEVAVTRLQVRRLLAILGARSQSWTSTDILMESLWPDRLPADPRAALSVVMARLRTCLGERRAALESGDKGHRLHAVVDVVEFERLLASGRQSVADDPDQAIRMLERCHAMWRGTPFVELENTAAVRPVAGRLDEAWWSATTLLAAAYESKRDHSAVIALTAHHHREHPHREALAAALARSLAAAGRKAEALETLSATTRALRDDLGLDVSAVIKKLEHEILHGSVELVAVAPADRPATRSQFVGRDKELQMLTTLRPGLRVLIGDAGMGKSTLLRQVGFDYVERGVAVISTAASQTPQRPMECIADLVEQLVEHAPPRPDEQLLRSALGRIVPSLESNEVGLQALTRDVLIGSVADYIARSCPANETLLIVDDCQWLDQASVLVLGRLARDGRCSVIVGTRPDESGRAAGLTDRLDDAVLSCVMGPLSQDEVTSLVLGELPSATSTTATKLWQRSGGHPLFVSLLIEMLVEGESDEAGLPSTVLIAVQQRLHALSTRARETIQSAAVIGTTFPMSVIRQLSANADIDIDEAVATGVIVVDNVRDEGSFIHELVREGAYQLLPDGRRVMLHDEIGSLLESAGADAGEYARHFSEASALDPLRAAVARYDAALLAANAYSWDVVEDHAVRGLSHVEGSPDLIEARLAVLLGRAQRFLHRDRSDDALIRGAAKARELGENELFADAVVALSVQNWSTTGAVSAEAVALFEEALLLHLTPTNRARVCAAGSTFIMTDRNERGRELYHEALDIALTLDDPTVQAEVLRYSRWGLIHPDDFAMLNEATILLADLAGLDPDLRWGAATNRFAIGTISGDRKMVDRAMVGLRAIQKSIGPSARDWEMSHLEAGYAILLGDLDSADAWLDRAFHQGSETTSRDWMISVYGAGLVGLRRAQGRLDEILPFVDQAISSRPDFAAWHCAAAASAAAAGQRERVVSELSIAARDDFDDLIPDATWSAVMVMLADAVEFVGDVDLAGKLVAKLEPYAGRMSWSGVATLGPIDDALASLRSVIAGGQG